jgi:bilirubin oxidase
MRIGRLVATLVSVVFAGLAISSQTRPYQNLHIPTTLSGTSFKLRLHKGSHSFWTGATTATYSYNDEPFWGPTLLLNKGDDVKIEVANELDEPTTVHWHGIHLPAKEDGGPHQLVPPTGVWTSHFKVDNNAATYWYHPHPHEATQKQLTMGAGGLLIIRDPAEAKLNLPRTYGVDDIPLVLTSRRFTTDNEFQYRGDTDKYGDYLFVNGTLDPQVTLPSQWVRLRVLNAEVERGYDLGFKDGREFYVIATDGGLVDRPVPVKRLKLMVGERVELLVNLGSDRVGSSVDLYSYNARQPFGFPGGEPGTNPPNGSYLNNANFPVLHINVGPTTASAVKAMPDTLAQNRLWTESEATVSRTIHINGGGPPDKEFQFGGQYFSMDRVDQVVKLGDVESWTVTNDQIFGHSFHIHDIQFSLVSRDGQPVPAHERGWKDTVYVPRGSTVKFVTRFADFASDRYPFMYHCHMSNHEDGGLMGQFLVVRDPATLKRDDNGDVRLGHDLEDQQGHTGAASVPKTMLADTDGKPFSATDTATAPLLLFFVKEDCPCSRDAAAFVNQLARLVGPSRVVGVIDSDPTKGREWQKSVAAQFRVVCDPNLSMAKEFGVTRGASFAIVSNAMSAKVYGGYSAGWLRRMASKLGTGDASLLFADAPTKPRAGCMLARDE